MSVGINKEGKAMTENQVKAVISSFRELIGELQSKGCKFEKMLITEHNDVLLLFTEVGCILSIEKKKPGNIGVGREIKGDYRLFLDTYNVYELFINSLSKLLKGIPFDVKNIVIYDTHRKGLFDYKGIIKQSDEEKAFDIILSVGGNEDIFNPYGNKCCDNCEHYNKSLAVSPCNPCRTFEDIHGLKYKVWSEIK